MNKSKLFLIFLILFALLLPPLIVSVSSRTISIQEALLFQAVNSRSPQNTFSGLNQPYVQTINIITQNIECAKLHQKEINVKTPYFYSDYAFISSRLDIDLDGYYSLITIGWDTDTNLAVEQVYVSVYSRDKDNNVVLVGNSSVYPTYHGEGTNEYEYMDIVVNTRGTYDFSLVLYNESGYEKDKINFGVEPNITDIRMESWSDEISPFIMAFLLPIILNAQRISMVPWIAITIMAVVGSIIVGVVCYIILSVRETPLRP
ncbi:MAG: hypothetical protein ACETWM_09735 [Candidatus Lokiarchaeia archaeon]